MSQRQETLFENENETILTNYLQSKDVSLDTIQKLIQNKLSKMDELRQIGGDLDDVCDECDIKGVEKVKLKVAIHDIIHINTNQKQYKQAETIININTDINIDHDKTIENSSSKSSELEKEKEDEEAVYYDHIKDEPKTLNIQNENSSPEDLETKQIIQYLIADELYDSFTGSFWRLFIEILDLINSIFWLYSFQILSGNSLYSIVWFFEMISFSIKSFLRLLGIIFFIMTKCGHSFNYLGFHALKYLFTTINVFGKIIYSFNQLSNPL
eukprot:415182_1